MLTADVTNNQLFHGQPNALTFTVYDSGLPYVLTGFLVVLYLHQDDCLKKHEVSASVLDNVATASLTENFCGNVSISLKVNGSAVTLSKSDLYFLKEV